MQYDAVLELLKIVFMKTQKFYFNVFLRVNILANLMSKIIPFASQKIYLRL